MSNSYKYYNRRKTLIIVLVTVFVLAAVGCGIYAYIYNQRMLKEEAVTGMKSEINSNDSVSMLLPVTSNDDFDGDGLKNGQESHFKTDFTLEDTDGDGLNDLAETSYGTDPLSKDSDGDGLLDGYEIKAGLNPNAAKTDGTHSDSSQRFVTELSDGNVTVKITGNANCYDSAIHTANIVALTSNPYIVSEIYDLSCRYTFDSAEITFSLDKDKLKMLALKPSQLTIYNYNTVSKVLEPVESTLDGNNISATVTHFSIYCVGVKSLATESISTQILFVIDNSGSMYPVEMCIDSDENDVDFKRLDMVRGIIENLGTDEYGYRIAKFTASYDRLNSGSAFSSDKNELEKIINRIQTEFPYFDGTDISKAIDNAVSELNESGADGHRIIVLLTDGDGTENNPYTAAEITKIIKDSSAVLLTIGLGNAVDADYLSDMAEGTGGMYYTASNADSLSRVCSDISAMLTDAVTLPEGNSNGKDTNNYTDGYIVADCGFDIVDGFTLSDYPTADDNSESLGIAALASAYYSGQLSPIQPDESDGKGYQLTETQLWSNFTRKMPLSEYTSSVFGGDYLKHGENLDFDKDGATVSIREDVRSSAIRNGFLVKSISFVKKYLGGIFSWEMLAVPISSDGSISSDVFAANYKDESAVFSAVSWFKRRASSERGYLYIGTDSGEIGFGRVVDAVRSGEPVIAVITEKNSEYRIGRNALTIMKILKCPKNDFDYYLCVYDSKTPDEEQWIKVRLTRQTEKNDKGAEYALTADYTGGGLSYTGASLGFYLNNR